MKKILLIIFLLILKETYGCRYCDFWKSDLRSFYQQFHSTIEDLPGDVKFLGPCNNIDRIGYYSREALADHAQDYYFLEHFPSYSVRGILHLSSSLKKDVNNEYRRIIDRAQKHLNDLILGKQHCYWINEKKNHNASNPW